MVQSVHVQHHAHVHDHYMPNGEHLVSHDIAYSNIGTWLKKGWMDIAHAPVSLFYGLVTMLFVLLTVLFYREQPFLMFNIATSFVMVTPFLATGLYDISRRLKQGKRPDLIASMFAWRHNVTEFALYALVVGVVIAIWSRITPMIVAVVQSQSLLIVDPSQGVMTFLMSTVGLEFLVAFIAVGSVVAAFVFVISVVTIPLLLKDDNIGVITSMILSYQIVMENKKVMALWALTIGALITVGLLTMGIALAVIMPLLGFASWHAFEDLISFEK